MNELKKFKHILVPLILLLICYKGLTSFWSADEAKRTAVIEENQKRQKVLELVGNKQKLEQSVDQSTGKLYKGDYNDFMNMVGNFAVDSRVSILSSRKSDVPRVGKGDEVFKDYDAELIVEGKYEAIVSFVGKIDAVQEYVVVTSVSLAENTDGSASNTVRANISMRAKTLGKIKI